MLLYTVLAVAYSGLLVSARHLDVFRNIVEDGDADMTDDLHYAQNENDFDVDKTSEDYAWSFWAPEHTGQRVIGSHAPHYAEDADDLKPVTHWSDVDLPNPKAPHDFPKSPQHIPVPPPHVPSKKGPFPGAPQHHDTAKTIYQILESQPQFSRIFKLVNATEDITKLLNDSTVNVTFLATPDWAFPKRRPPPPRKGGVFDWKVMPKENDNIADFLVTAEGLLDHDPKPDVLLKFLKRILLYETLPSRLTASELSKNATFPTSLTLSDGSFDGQPLRVRAASSALGQLYLNLFVTVVKPNIPASNGLIHVTNQFVLPTPASFQVAFLLTDIFSVLSSAIQRVGLTDDVDWRDVKDHTVVGSPAVTLFAPTNKAFSRLPRRLKTFLFSPFGERALKKLLQFHVVPEFVLHTNFFHNASESDIMPLQDDAGLDLFYDRLSYDLAVIADDYELGDEEFSTTFTSFEYMPPPAAHSSILQGGDLKYNTPPAESWPSWSGKPHFPHHPEDHRRSPFADELPHHSPFPGEGPHDSPFSGQVPPHCPPPACSPTSRKRPFPFPPRPLVVYSRNMTAPTLLGNHALPVHVVQFAHGFPIPGHGYHITHYKTEVFANGLHVKLPDISTRNGALHIIDRLLNPFRKPKGPHHALEDYEGPMIGSYVLEEEEDEWTGWEEWLPAWAGED